MYSGLEEKKKARYRTEEKKLYQMLKILIEQGNANRTYVLDSMQITNDDMKRLAARLLASDCLEEKMVETRISGMKRMGYSVTEKGRELYRYLSEMYEVLLRE